MSQNNYTLIEQIEKNKYEVSNRDADTDVPGKTYICKTIEEAVKKAIKVEEGCHFGGSEYGIRIKLLK